MSNEKRNQLRLAEDMPRLTELLKSIGHEPITTTDYPQWYSYSFKSQKDYEARLSFITVTLLQKDIGEGNFATRLRLHDNF